MSKALSYAVRQKIVERRQKQQSYPQIAQALNCSVSGVKKIWYAYQKHGKTAFNTQYSNCGGHSIYGDVIREKVNDIRDNQQGSYYVHSKLVEKHPNLKRPSTRTLNRWWQKEGTNRQKGKPSSSEKKMVKTSS